MIERVAVVSDVHGNLTAYEAVLADIRRREISRIINLGDVIGKGPRGSQCTALTRTHCEMTIRGNWEVYLAGPRVPEHPGPKWWSEELTDEDRTWLYGLPGSVDLELSGRLIRMVHASPIDEFTRVQAGHRDDEFTMMFEPTTFTGDGRADVVVYGDIHDAYLKVRPSRMLINVGSVGNPLDEPVPSYVIIEGGQDADSPFGVQFVRVPYDIEAEVTATQALDMPEAEAYITELRTAVHRGSQSQQ